jgi:hypothetical protein
MQDPGLPHLPVTVYDYAHVGSDTIAFAQQIAADVYRKAGVTIDWIDGCEDSPHSFHINLLPTKMTTHVVVARAALGFAGAGSQTADVIYDRVTSLALSHGMTGGQVLGFVMAHELGRLLLPSRSHSSSGLIRAAMDLQLAKEKNLWFTPEQAALIAAKVSVEAVPHTLGVGRARLRVRVYDTAVMPAGEQTVALRAATGVLAAAGIDITWLECGRDDSGMNPSECDLLIGRDDLVVRLLRLPGEPTMHGELPLGYSLIDMRAAAGVLATIYVDRVSWLSAGANVDMGLVLGRAVAHEIGHLLLGTNVHGAAGLMRAVWSRAELQRDEPFDWLFTTRESVAMRAALRHRRQQIEVAANSIWTK